MADSNETTCNDKSTEIPPPAMNSQESSYFFQLPLELRTSIYGHLFQNTRLTSGQSDDLYTGIIPARHSLALLKTCHRVRTEIGDTWLGQVLFNFTSIESMMVTLKALPMETLSKIRHLRVLGTVLKLDTGPAGAYSTTSYPLVQMLKLLPGLQLDTFTVLTAKETYCDYLVLDTLVKYGMGWKELRFICRCASQFRWGIDYSHHPFIEPSKPTFWYERKPQPADWIGIMNSRDGIQSQPSVTMYQSTLRGVPCSVMHEATRELVDQMPLAYEVDKEIPASSTGQCFYIPYGEREEEKTREFMVVVKRGEGIDYQEIEDSPYLPDDGDIREDFASRQVNCKTWEQVMTKYLDWWHNGTNTHHDEPPRTDRYKHVNEYAWVELWEILKLNNYYFRDC